MTTRPPIEDAGTLLALLRENPAQRAVSYCRDDDDYFCPAIVDFKTDDPRGAGRFIAWIEKPSAASALLNDAREADSGTNLVLWASMPLRYGPYCSTWVLPEHPRAPQTPGAEA